MILVVAGGKRSRIGWFGGFGKVRSGGKVGVGLKIENILERHLNDYKPVKPTKLILFSAYQ